MSDFDCVAMKRVGAKKVLQEIKGMTIEEETKFWALGTKELLKKQKKLTSESPGPRKNKKTSKR